MPNLRPLALALARPGCLVRARAWAAGHTPARLPWALLDRRPDAWVHCHHTHGGFV